MMTRDEYIAALIECAEQTFLLSDPDFEAENEWQKYRIRVNNRVGAARFRKRHPERHREFCKRYRMENPEKVRAAAKYNRERHPERTRANAHRRRARIQAAEGSFTAADVRLQMKAQTDKHGRLRCWKCGEVIEGDDYEIDHWQPLAKQGSNEAENIRILHIICNRKKGAKSPAEFGRLL